MRAMRNLETRFNRKHPELMNHRPVPPQLVWLQSAFLRLHRRRRFSDMGGMQPLSLMEIADFGERNLQLPKNLWPMFSVVMEVTDDAVLMESYLQRTESKK